MTKNKQTFERPILSEHLGAFNSGVRELNSAQRILCLSCSLVAYILSCTVNSERR